MSLEIERKFLVDPAQLPPLTGGIRLEQGYALTPDTFTLRIRIAGTRGYLALKQPVTGIVRKEHEVEIPLADAQELLEDLCRPRVVRKVRYRIPVAGLVWEIDVFEEANAGLILAELELTDPEQSYEAPPWLGPEVTFDRRYGNSRLAITPYCTWPAPT